jgi:hypothetical protein
MWLAKKKGPADLRFELKQKKIITLVDKMLEAEVEVTLAPISEEYFIVDKSREIYISLSDSLIRISNHSYLYEISCTSVLMSKLMAKAKLKVEEKANRIKKELFKNEIELLDKLNKLYTKTN